MVLTASLKRTCCEFLGQEESGDIEIADVVRIILAAADDSREITTTVMWLNKFENMDIRCIRLVPYAIDGEVYIDIQQVVPFMPENTIRWSWEPGDASAGRADRIRSAATATRPGASAGTTGCFGAMGASRRYASPWRGRRSSWSLFGHSEAARSACAAMDSAGLTPRFAETAAPSITDNVG